MLTPTKIVPLKSGNETNVLEVEVVESNINMTKENTNMSIPTSVNNETKSVEIVDNMANIPSHLRDKVMSIKNSITMNDPSSIEKYGSDIQSVTTSNIMSEIKVGESGLMGERIGLLLKTTKSLDPSELIDKKPNFFSKLVGMVKEPITEFKNKQKTVQEAINEIAKGLDDDAKKLIARNVELAQKYEQNKIDVENFNVNVAAGRICCSEIETNTLPKLKQVAETTQKEEDVFAYSDAKNFLIRLESRVSRLDAARAITLRRSPTIRNMQDNNAKEAEVIRDLIQIAVPAWKQEMELHIINLETKRAMENERNVVAAINETMVKSSEMMRDNSIEIAKNANGTLIEIETIRTVQTNLIQTITEIENINKAGKIKREEMAKELILLDEEFKKAIIK